MRHWRRAPDRIKLWLFRSTNGFSDSLRRNRAGGYDLIIAEAIPEEGLGAAIMDRLRRAAVRPDTTT